MTTKRSRPRQPQVKKSNWSVRRHRLKSSADGSRATQKHKTHDASRSFVGVQQTLLAAFRVCRSTSLLRVCPENLRWSHVVPSLVRGLQPNRRKDDVDGPMAQNEPLVLGLDKPAAVGPHAAVGRSARAPQWRNTRSRPRNIGVAEGGFEWRDPTLVGGDALKRVHAQHPC